MFLRILLAMIKSDTGSAAEDDLPTEADAIVAFDRAKARKAARDPKRPGEHCRAEPRTYEPRVDRNRCEGKSDCVAVCPYGVFEVRRIDDEDFRALSFLGRMKSRAHKRLTAYTPNADACRACGLCVVACPEEAIVLAPRAEGA
jgi:NAD-dependent dihydropyrimidine dehydrogenase PreA subunit